MSKNDKRRLFIDRKDGKRVEGLSGLSQICIDLKPNRSVSDVFINQKIDVTNLENIYSAIKPYYKKIYLTNGRLLRVEGYDND